MFKPDEGPIVAWIIIIVFIAALAGVFVAGALIF